MAKWGKNAVNVIAKIFTGLLTLSLVLGIVGGVWYFSNGFDGRTSTFLVKYGGNVYLQDSDLGEIRSGTEFEVYSVEEYDVRITARKGSDLAFTVGSIVYSWDDIAGEDLTKAFRIENTDSGFAMSYSGLIGILSEYCGINITILGTFEKVPEFDLLLRTSKSELRFSFQLSIRANSISSSSDNIIFF